MANNLKNVGKVAVEDGVEDFFQALIFRRMQKATAPFLKEFETDSEFDEAMQSFINTLSVGFSIYAFQKVTSFFFERGAKLGTLLWTYIVAGKMKKRLLDKLKNSNFKGSKALRAIGLVLDTDRTSERIEVAKLVQSNINSYDLNKFHYQNQSLDSQKSLDNLSIAGMMGKGSVDGGISELVMFKTKNAEWTVSNEDKRLFEKFTGKKLVATGKGSWSSVYKELNRYTELYKTLEGETSNISTMMAKILTRNGAI